MISHLLLIFRISVFTLLSASSSAQLKYLVEDFEGLADGGSDMKPNGVYTYGFMKANVDSKIQSTASIQGNVSFYLGKRALKLEKQSNTEFGGWGKGVGFYVELDRQTDYFNFFFYSPSSSTIKIKLELQEDDDGDHIFNKERDDCHTYTLNLRSESGGWEMISVPLKDMKDANAGGDHDLNVGYRNGKLLNLLFYISEPGKINKGQNWYIDFLCFSKGKLETGNAKNNKEEFCLLGAWSGEGNHANFTEIASSFESNFSDGKKKIGIVHFFQPFGTDAKSNQYHYPSVERINNVINAGYIPMITLEDHYIQSSGVTPPNLYSIVEGHYDSFFGYWASQIKQVKGTVLLRILHEFNGDWYPWCTVNNDKNPELVARAFRYIHNIFKENQVNNVKFIWCPNSMSLPQQPWNYIMEAYPGNDYVDFVGLDIYNGAGDGATWRSFLKEGIENYFLLTQNFPDKPFLVCETASRERRGGECSSCQDKAEWIMDMSNVLKTEMTKVRLLSWFNEKETFKLNSSASSKEAYLNHIARDVYFKSGADYFYPLIK